MPQDKNINFDDMGDASLFGATKRSIQRKIEEVPQAINVDIYTQARSLVNMDREKQSKQMEALFRSNDKQASGLVS